MSEARQRWRLIFGRGEEARYLSHLDAARLWERAFRRAALPVAMTEGMHPRPRLVFAAPLQVGMLAEHELADLYLAERRKATDLREELSENLPRGYRLVELYDVWTGAAALATQLVAADYRMGVLGAESRDLREAAAALLAAAALPREKKRESKAVAYDLRPLLIDLRIEEPANGSAAKPANGSAAEPANGSAVVRVRLRHSQEQGSGRAEEVVSALGERVSGAQSRLEIVRPVRERLWIAEEMPEDRGFGAG